MSNTSINRAVAAMQIAKGQKDDNNTQQPPKTNLFDAPTDSSNAHQKTELKPAFLNQNFDSKSPSPSPERPKANLVRVDLSIAGTPHRIDCPSNDVDNLNKVAEQINEALREMRRNVRGKSPSNEELLVLHCLELHDKINELKRERQHQLIEQERANALLDKILKDARATLKPY